MDHYAGIDLGATHVRAAVANEAGSIVAREREETPQGPDGERVTEAVLTVLEDACREAGIHPTDLRAVGVGAIGPLDLARGTVVEPANLPDAIEEIPLREPLSELVGTDAVTVHNDTTAGVIGERFYSDLNPDDMVYLTISSGIGAGIAVDGNVLGGWDGNAGEVGHMVVDPAGRMPCGCGHDGHWEAYCSGTNIPAYARHLHEQEPVETALPIDGECSAADVFDRPDDPLAARTIERVTSWNAIGVANIVHAYAPLVIAVGGAVALNNVEHVIDPLRERVPDMIFTGMPEIKPTVLGEDVVLRGAIASAITGGTGAR